jgi:hypothetical protein
LEADEIVSGFGVDDGAALHFVERELEHVVSSHVGARAYVVEKVGSEVRERVLESEYLLKSS